MALANDNNSLLSALQARYRQVVNLLIRLRLSNYSPRTQLGTGKKLTSQLRKYIKQTPEPAAKNIKSNEHIQPRPNLPFDHVTTDTIKEPLIAEPDSHHDLETKLTVQPSAGDNLMRSTWEHLRASIRCAKAGDKEKARLHASIMDSALGEAARFLGREEYQEFVQKLEQELSSHGR